MRQMLLILFLSNIFVYGSSLDKQIEKKIDVLLNQMTIEEKAGQMTQITLEAVSKPRVPGSFVNILDLKKLENAIVAHHVGSLLNTGGQANTLQNWRDMIRRIQDMATQKTRLSIPVLYGIDAIHGANYTKGATIFPQSIAMAATFNTLLMKEAARITALEVRASGIPWNFNPVLGVGRNPLWSRFFETFGESPFVVSEFGKAYIEGLQGNAPMGDHVLACMKHFVGYSFPLNGFDRTPAWIPERMMRDIFLPPFKTAVMAGARTVMVNSSEVNGIPTHSNHHLLTDILKNEYGFTGFVVSDWEDIKRLYERDGVAASPEDAVRMAVMAGVDMSMVPYDFSFYDHLVKLVKEDKVPQSRIDDAVRRILRVKFEAGLFDHSYPDKKLQNKFGLPAFVESSYRAAGEAITLLKNKEDILPLKKNTKVLVTGPTSNLLSAMNGGWTITWQGNEEKLYPKEKQTLLRAIQNTIGKEKVTYLPGAGFESLPDLISLQKKAEKVDVIIVALGENAYCETPGNIKDLSISSAQIRLAEAAYKTGKPVVLVLFEGRPRVIHPIVDKASAIVMGYLPGMEGGRAMADVLFGNINPSGKLPFTYPESPNGFVTYDHKPLEEFDLNNYEYEFPFGHGLSYTKFLYKNLRIDKKSCKIEGGVTVRVTVENIGGRAGLESVLVYGRDLVGSVSRPTRQLIAFDKINLKPGESRELVFKIPIKRFAFTNRENKKVIEPGAFKIYVSNLEQSFVVE
ncbi:MAG: beta-glucosidase [Calditrichaeota bacterium]|nr:MAG: beta-glucosidase [Calditrichota bacterium]